MRSRLRLSLAVLLVLLVGYSVFVVGRMTVLSDHWDEVATTTIPVLDLTGELTWLIARYRIAEDELVLGQNPAQMAARAQQMAALEADIRRLIARHDAIEDSPADRAEFARFAAAFERYLEVSRGAVYLAWSENPEEAGRRLLRSGEAYAAMSAHLATLAHLNRSEAEQRRAVGTAAFDQAVRGSIIAVLLGLVASMALIVAFNRTVLRPIATLVGAVQRLDAGDLQAPIAGRTRPDELGEIARALEVLKGSAIERERLQEQDRAELAFAHQLQLSTVPHRVPAFPDRPEMDVGGRLIPTRAVGGDFYDYYFIDPQHLALSIGDASGKGVASALFVGVTRGALKTTSLRISAPGACLTEANRTIAPDNEELMFVTAFHAVADVATGELVYANAGHCPPYLVRADGTVALLPNTPALPLGPLEDTAYGERSVRLARGDALVLYTDGVTEATAAGDALYGAARLEAVLAGLGGAAPERMLAAILESVDAFVAGAPQADDITLLVYQWRGAPTPPA